MFVFKFDKKMSTRTDTTQKGYQKVIRKEGPNLQVKTVILVQTNQHILTTNSYSGAVSIEIANLTSDLSGSATINIEMSVSGADGTWLQATDANGDNFTYTLTAGGVINEAISGIPEGTILRAVLSGSVTGTLEIATRQ